MYSRASNKHVLSQTFKAMQGRVDKDLHKKTGDNYQIYKAGKNILSTVREQ